MVRDFLREDPDLGWVLDGGALLRGEWHIANRQGFRDAKDFATIDYLSGKTRVMLLGDSFLFGIGLHAQETIPAMLERKLPDREFYNLGIPGWGLDQMYLSYKKYADLIKPQIVVLLYIDDDVQRIYEAFRILDGMNKPSFSVSKNRLVPREPGAESPWKRYVIDKSVIANRFYIAYRKIDIKRLANALFTALIEETQERGQQFIVLRLPLLSDGPEAWRFKEFFCKDEQSLHRSP